MSQLTIACQHCYKENIVDFPKYLDSYFQCGHCHNMNVMSFKVEVNKFEVFTEMDPERLDVNIARAK